MKQMPTWVCLLIGFLGTTKFALAQGPAATISGTVRDQTGAVLPGAGLLVTSQETGRVRLTVGQTGGSRFAALLKRNTASQTAQTQKKHPKDVRREPCSGISIGRREIAGR